MPRCTRVGNTGFFSPRGAGAELGLRQLAAARAGLAGARDNDLCVTGEAPSKTLVETAKEATEKAKETALAATEKAKDLASKAATKKKQYV